jgi:predicted dehydrogenase
MAYQEKIRVGLAGCGYWGSKHLRVLNELPDCELTALCEPAPANLEKVSASFLPPFVTGDFDELLESDIEAVVIAAPARLHYPLAKAALLKGKHVLTEKPFATTSQDALDLAETAQARGLTLMVGHTYVFHPAVQYLRELVKSGDLGSLHYVHTARLNFGLLQPDVDVLWDLAPHDLSILAYLLDDEPMVAAARGVARINPHLAEVAHLDLEFMDGLFAHIHVSWLEPVKVRRITLIGSRKTVVYDDVSQGEMIRVYNKSIELGEPNGENGFLPPLYRNGDVTIPFVQEQEPLKLEDAHFLDCIRTGARPRSDGWQGLKVVSILETASKSLYNGGAMEDLTPRYYFQMKNGNGRAPNGNGANGHAANGNANGKANGNGRRAHAHGRLTNGHSGRQTHEGQVER